MTGREIATMHKGGKSGGGPSFMDELKNVASGAVTAFKGVTPILGEIINLLTAAAQAALGAGVAIAGLGIYSMKTAADMEALKMGLKAVLGSTEAANKEFAKLQEIAKLPGINTEQAVKGFIDLVAGGVDVTTAERGIMAFGNAMAAAGRSSEELSGALYGLRQLATSNSILAEDLNIIIDRVPQAAKILRDLYGSARGEDLVKMGVTNKQVVEDLIRGTEKLDKVTGGAKNAFENFGMAVQAILVSIGDELNKNLLPLLQRVVANFERFNKLGAFSGIIQEYASRVNRPKVQDILLEQQMKTQQGRNAVSVDTLVGETAKQLPSADPINKFIAIAVATLERVPDYFGLAVDLLKIAVDNARKTFTQIITFLQSVLDTIDRFLPGDQKKTLVNMVFGDGTDKVFTDFKLLNKERDDAAARMLGRLDQSFMEDLAKKADPANPENAPTAPPPVPPVLDQIAANTAKTAENTKPGFDPGRNIAGGGDLARLGVTATEMQPGVKVPKARNREAQNVLDALARLLNSTEMVATDAAAQWSVQAKRAGY